MKMFVEPLRKHHPNYIEKSIKYNTLGYMYNVHTLFVAIFSTVLPNEFTGNTVELLGLKIYAPELYMKTK